MFIINTINLFYVTILDISWGDLIPFHWWAFAPFVKFLNYFFTIPWNMCWVNVKYAFTSFSVKQWNMKHENLYICFEELWLVIQAQRARRPHPETIFLRRIIQSLYLNTCFIMEDSTMFHNYFNCFCRLLSSVLILGLKFLNLAGAISFIIVNELPI